LALLVRMNPLGVRGKVLAREDPEAMVADLVEVPVEKEKVRVGLSQLPGLIPGAEGPVSTVDTRGDKLPSRGLRSLGGPIPC
jgi:hypothetical protein